MSCGCGGGGRLPARVTLRLEAARLALTAEAGRFDELAPRIFAFVTEGVNVENLDAPPAPVATGTSAEAVTSRSVLLNTPVQRVPGLDRKAVAALVAAGGPMPLGTLAQANAETLASSIGVDEVATLAVDLTRYGLDFDLGTEALRKWVVEGAAQ